MVCARGAVARSRDGYTKSAHRGRSASKGGRASSACGIAVPPFIMTTPAKLSPLGCCSAMSIEVIAPWLKPAISTLAGQGRAGS